MAQRRKRKGSSRKRTPKNRRSKWPRPTSRQILGLLVGAASVLGFSFAALQFYRAMSPKVSPVYDSTDPYAAPYQIRNEGSWFTMYDVTPSCGIEDFKIRGIEMRGFSISVGVQGITIPPGRSAIYFCRTDLAGARPHETQSAAIVIEGSYVLHFIPRWWIVRKGFASDVFNLQVDESGQSHWLEGQIIE